MNISEHQLQSPDVGSSMQSGFPKKASEARMQRVKGKTALYKRQSALDYIK